MPGYICLMKFTQQGISAIKELSGRIEAARSEAQKLGIKIVGLLDHYGTA